MRTIAAVCVSVLLLPPHVEAQSEPATLRQNLDSLWGTSEVEATTNGLAEQFVSHFLLLVPDLPMADQVLLADAAVTAFDPDGVRRYLTAKVASEASPEVVVQLLEMRRSGAQAEMRQIAAGHTPTQPLEDFVAGLDDEGRARVQLMARLAEAQGRADFALLVDEGLRRSAHEFFISLGGATAFEPLSDAGFDASYRDRILSQALEFLHTLEPVPDQLIEATIDEYSSAAEQWYSDAYLGAILEAVSAAGKRVVSLTQAAEEQAEPDEPDPALAGMPCRAEACGFVVDWQGRQPTDFNRRFGASGDLEIRVLERLVGAGYVLERGIYEEGLTMRLRARTMIGLCEAMSGTDNTGCTAIDQVRVEFLGSIPDYETPGGFIIRNRCGADSAMDVNGFSTQVALRLHYELTGDERDVPNC